MPIEEIDGKRYVSTEPCHYGMIAVEPESLSKQLRRLGIAGIPYRPVQSAVPWPSRRIEA